MTNTYAYIGNWEQPDKGSEVGITLASYDSETGKLDAISHSLPDLNCGAMCLDEERGILYCVDERVEVSDETPGGRVVALKINPDFGEFTLLNCSPSYGGLPSSCAIDSTKSYLIVTNRSKSDSIMKTVKDSSGCYRIVREYDEASVVLFRLNKDGSIGEPCDIVCHKGHGLLPNQQSPHPHSIVRAPLCEVFIVCDNGNDTIYSYKIDRKAEKLIECDKIDGISGSSPGYCAFHPTLPYFYYNNETKPIIGVVQYDTDGKLSPVCYISCIGTNSGSTRGIQSDIKVDAQGRYMYDSVRETGKIVVYEIDPVTGVPSLVQTVSSGIKDGGRGLALSPDGHYLYLAAYPDSEVRIFEVDADGKLNGAGTFEDIAPGDVTFFTVNET